MTQGGLSYTAAWNEAGLSPYIGAIATKEACLGLDKDGIIVQEGVKQYIVKDSGCDVEWNDTIKRCQVKGADCGYDSIEGRIRKKVNEVSQEKEDPCAGTFLSCWSSGGTSNPAANKGALECCLCGDKKYSPGIYKCNKDEQLESTLR